MYVDQLPWNITLNLDVIMIVYIYQDKHMDRVFAWDHDHNQVVYRIPGHHFDDGREDSDLSPVWVPADESDLPEGVTVDDLRTVSVND